MYLGWLPVRWARSSPGVAVEEMAMVGAERSKEIEV